MNPENGSEATICLHKCEQFSILNYLLFLSFIFGAIIMENIRLDIWQ